jgi:chromosomal replication initiation ATPase DnaA
MTRETKTDLLTILQDLHDMIGADRPKLQVLINEVAAIGAKKNPKDSIFDVIELTTGISKTQLKLKSRNRDRVNARFMAAAMFQKINCNDAEIGELIGRDRTSAIYSIKMHETLFSTDKKYRETFLKISGLIKNV